MKIWRGVLLLALLHSIVVLAHNNYHNNTDRHVKKKKPNSILHKLWKRDVNCPGEYSTKTHCCKLCDAGTFAESDCAENHGRPNCRNCLEGSNYMDEQNGYHECHKCWHCDKELGQEVLRACNMRQNTVCRCAENFFCTGNGTVEDGGCRACKHCTKCEFKQAEPCTATKDTVCKSQRYHRILIVPFVSIPLLLLLLLVLYGVRGKRGTASTGNSPHPVVSIWT
ncbi:tumor necrosis factor receptor superfamily member 6 isoform X2 [Rhinoderma darwinii]|uniref:tumor necrosis factor receptor superfamily member 6 isoform X2 n=1 Tax=Rhinoderma darwinii TaxID=43563 RepID=UPI003F66B537